MIVIAQEEERRLVKIDEPVIVTGVGAINIMRAMRNVPRDEPILNIGYAGSNRIPVGTVVKVGRVALYHPHAEYPERVFFLNGDTPCYTSCDFVTETEVQEDCVFDMELAFILGMGFTNVTALKVVSDNLDKNQYDLCVSQ